MQMEMRNDGSLEVSGYVNAVDRYSKELYSERGKFIEKVKPETFNKALARAENIDMLLKIIVINIYLRYNQVSY